MTSPTKAEIDRSLYGKGYRPEKALQDTILQYLALERIWAIRLNTASMVAEDASGKKRIVKAHSGGKGVADILALVNQERPYLPLMFKPLWVEVKAEGKKQRPEQKSFQLDVERRGHFYIVAYRIEEVIYTVRQIRGE